MTAFLESYFASTTEILISFSVSLRSNAPPSATLTRSSYSVLSESLSTALPASSVIDHTNFDRYAARLPVQLGFTAENQIQSLVCL